MSSVVKLIFLAVIGFSEAIPRSALERYPAIRPYFLDSADLDTLKFVQILHRHGDRNRNEEESYPNDPHKDVTIGPKGRGQLTAIGKANGFELGRYLRARYDGFLSPVYSIEEIVATSSDRDRTIMTCQALLAGLFPPTNNDPEGNWNEKLKWQPIPVHVLSNSQDNFLLQTAKCPKYTALIEEEKSSDIVKNFDKKYEQFYADLSRHSGEEIHNPIDAYKLIDILIVEKAHGLRLPSWTDEPGFWINAIQVSKQYYRNKEGYTLQAKRLRAGALISKIISNMEQKRNETEGLKAALPKILEYSAHDSTVYSFLFGMSMPDLELPPYASAILMELHKASVNPRNVHHDPYFVKIFFRNETTAPAYELQIPKCTTPCTLSQLKTLYSDVLITPEQWTSECQV